MTTIVPSEELMKETSTLTNMYHNQAKSEVWMWLTDRWHHGGEEIKTKLNLNSLVVNDVAGCYNFIKSKLYWFFHWFLQWHVSLPQITWRIRPENESAGIKVFKLRKFRYFEIVENTISFLCFLCASVLVGHILLPNDWNIFIFIFKCTSITWVTSITFRD